MSTGAFGAMVYESKIEELFIEPMENHKIIDFGHVFLRKLFLAGPDSLAWRCYFWRQPQRISLRNSLLPGTELKDFLKKHLGGHSHKGFLKDFLEGSFYWRQP